MARNYRATTERWRRENPERVREMDRRGHLKHRDERLAKMRAYYQKNKVRLASKHREYIEAHREVARSRKHRYEARLRADGQSFTSGEWLELLASFDGLCGYCGSTATSADHRIPVSRGGANTIDNIIPACRSCNSRKRHRTEEEFRAILI